MKHRRISSSGRVVKRVRKHKQWQVQEAKAKFSQVLNEAVATGYQTITKNGKTVAYIVSKEEFERLQPKKSFLAVFEESPYPDVDLDIRRSDETMRDVDL